MGRSAQKTSEGTPHWAIYAATSATKKYDLGEGSVYADTLAALE